MSQNKLRLYVAQMCSTNHHAGNIESLSTLVKDAAAAKADMLCLPEVSGLTNCRYSEAKKVIGDESDDSFLAACRELAASHRLWIHNGSIPVQDTGQPLPVNRTHLIAPDGTIAAKYDKIHLFDISLNEAKQVLESKRYAGGAESTLAQTPWGPMGLSICYDIRFPHLYRDYAKAGARIMFIPAAFTKPTGHAHWEVLLRARAIENGCYIVAAAQTGNHDDGRETYGHSMVVHPWGDVLMDLGEAVQGQLIEIDLSESDAARRQIPSLVNERKYKNNFS